MSPGCWGEGPAAALCPAPPAVSTTRMGAGKAGVRMDFCRRHFWLWNAACLELRGEPELAGMAPGIRRHVRAGSFDRAPVGYPRAIPYHMVAPDAGFDDASGMNQDPEDA